MAWGVVLGSALQIRVPGSQPGESRDSLFDRAIDFHHEGLRNVLRLMDPGRSLSIALYQYPGQHQLLPPVCGTIVGDGNGRSGWKVTLNYAFRFMQFPLGVFGVAIAAATLPEIARSAAGSDLAEDSYGWRCLSFTRSGY